MTDNQRKAYEWAKAHAEYRSVAARYAQELAGLVDELLEQKSLVTEKQATSDKTSGWISVEDRLPKPFVSVLVYMPQELP